VAQVHPTRGVASHPCANICGADGALEFLAQRTGEVCNADFISLVEGPLLEALRSHESSSDEYPHVLAHRRLTQSELLGNEQSANTVLLEIAVGLRPEMPRWLPQPAEDLQAPFVVERTQRFHELRFGDCRRV
jgi:hypothetical protein